MIATKDLVEEIFAREGRVYAEPPAIDQPTGPGGITLPTLQAYQPGSTLEDLKRLTVEGATAVILWTLDQLAERHGLALIQDDHVRLQMIDFAYNSGPDLAIRWLQRVVQAPRTSRMDVTTTYATNSSDPWLLHHALIVARLQMIDLATDRGTVSKRFEEGLENRVLRFSRLEIP